MKPATIKQIKDELKEKDEQELLDICLHLTRFKKENKELLTYLLFEASDESAYIEHVKEDMDEEFQTITASNYYLIKKSIRKILRNTKKQIRYSKNKETEVSLLLHFCQKLADFRPSIFRSVMLQNLYDRQIAFIRKKVTVLHEDLQYDFGQELDELDRDK